MTVTLELSPDAEAGLRERAAKRGQSIAGYLLTLAEETIAVIEEGLADLHAGDKGVLLEDYRAEVMAKREARKQQQEVGVVT